MLIIVEAPAIQKWKLVVRKYQKFHSYPVPEEHPGSLKTNVWSILNLAKVVKMHGFHGNLLSDKQEWGVPTKFIVSQLL